MRRKNQVKRKRNACTCFDAFVSCKSMQKQHLHIGLQLLWVVLVCGCGELEFPKLNPYTNKDQILKVMLPDSGSTVVSIGGWATEVSPPQPGDDHRLKLRDLSGTELRISWRFEGDQHPLPFRATQRTAQGLELVETGLGLIQSLSIERGGQLIECGVTGQSERTLIAEIEFHGPSSKRRGIDAETEPWSQTDWGAEVLLPDGNRWRLETEGTVTPAQATGLGASISFAARPSKIFTLRLNSDRDSESGRAVDILTEADSVNRTLALLTSLIPAATIPVSTSADVFEFWADLTVAQWLTFAEFRPDYFESLRAPEDQVWTIENGLKAFETAFRWGALPERQLTLYTPLLHDALNRLDAAANRIRTGATIEEQFRRAAVWLFAETYLASMSAPARVSYRSNSRDASKDAITALQQAARRLRQTRSEQTDSVYFNNQFIDGGSDGGDGLLETFVLPDSVSLFETVSRGTLSWLKEADASWLALEALPWDAESARLLWTFSQDIRYRRSEHWTLAFAALNDTLHPVTLPGELEQRVQTRAAAAELVTVVEGYLGVRPNWSARKIVFDPRLPDGWGRTRARIPFADGELYVDYDFAQRQAYIAASGLVQSFDCQLYFPTKDGAIAGQFTLEPGDQPHHFTLDVDSDNASRLRVTSGNLPE